MTRAPSSVAVIGTKIKKDETKHWSQGGVVLFASIIIFIESRISFLGNLMMFRCYSCKCLVDGMYAILKTQSIRCRF
jgi:hypothetical protein